MEEMRKSLTRPVLPSPEVDASLLLAVYYREESH